MPEHMDEYYPDIPTKESETIINLECVIKTGKEEIVQLKKKIKLAESVIDKLKPYDINQRQMVSSYYKDN